MTSSIKQRRLAALINEAATKSMDGAAWRKRMDRWLKLNARIDYSQYDQTYMTTWHVTRLGR